MNRRKLIMPLVLVLFVMQAATVIGLRLISPTDTPPADTTLDVVAIVVMAAVDYVTMRYLLRMLKESGEVYAIDLNRQLEQMLASYRIEARREEALVQQLETELAEEIRLARDALAEHSVDQMGEHLMMGLAIASKAPTSLCDNVAIAAVLDAKQRMAEAAGIRLETHVSLPEELPITEVAMTAIFFNLIDNAIHHCEKLQEMGYPLPTVEVQARMQAGQLFVEVTNPCPEHVGVERLSALLRDKTLQRHGLGTQIVETIVSHYHGISEFSEHEGVFTAAVMIPCA